LMPDDLSTRSSLRLQVFACLKRLLADEKHDMKGTSLMKSIWAKQIIRLCHNKKNAIFDHSAFYNIIEKAIDSQTARRICSDPTKVWNEQGVEKWLNSQFQNSSQQEFMKVVLCMLHSADVGVIGKKAKAAAVLRADAVTTACRDLMKNFMGDKNQVAAADFFLPTMGDFDASMENDRAQLNATPWDETLFASTFDRYDFDASGHVDLDSVAPLTINLLMKLNLVVAPDVVDRDVHRLLQSLQFDTEEEDNEIVVSKQKYQEWFISEYLD